MLPHKVGTISPDPAGSFHANPLCPTRCASAITIMYVPNTNAQTTISNDMPTPSAELKVHQQPGCGEDDRDLCGFNDGDRVLIFDPSGAYDIFTITNVQDNAIHLQHRDDKFTQKYYAGAWITKVESHTYYLSEVPATNTYQLRHYDGYQTDLPVADNVVDFRIEFFGDPLPPQLVRPVTDLNGPWTTYGPKPPAIGIDNKKDTWGDGENCIFQVDGTSGLHVARPQIQTLGWATGGPVAPAGEHAHRRSVVPSGNQCRRRGHAEQVRRRPAARAPGAGDLASAGGQRSAARARRRALPPRRPVQRRRALRPGPGSPLRRRAAQHEPGTLRGCDDRLPLSLVVDASTRMQG